MGLSQLALRLEQVTQERDPLAEALQQELGRESREAYLKDWRTFARWLEATSGHPRHLWTSPPLLGCFRPWGSGSSWVTRPPGP